MARRQTTTFSMSFLDVISCGFGAVVLFYTIISAQAGLYRIKETTDLSAEARKLEQEVLEGYKHLAELRNALDSTEDRKLRAVGLSREMQEKLKMTEEELARFEHDTLARRASLERLKADLKSLEESTRRLKEAAPPAEPTSRVPIVDKQQLVTLRIDGKRVLVLVDASASMLDETVVNIIRLRNMPPERRINSGKWQQAVNTVEWVASRLPDTTQFQIYAFDTAPRALVDGSAGRWLDARDSSQIEKALSALRTTAPTGGSSLQNAFAVIKTLDPAPDSVILVTDGLPTQGDKPPLMRTLVTHGAARRPDAGRGQVSAAAAAAHEHRIAADGRRSVGADLLLAPRSVDRRRLPEPGEGLAMKRRTRRDTETFSMSFLDCICCGFGAIILLLVLNEFGEPVQLEQSKNDLDAQIVKYEKEVFDIRGVAIVLERELRARIEELSEEQKRLARLRGDLSSIEGQHKASTDEEDALKKLNETLADARKSLIDETREIQRSGREQVYNQPVAGIPIDSEYVIFVVDTSGSMQSQNWRYAEQKLGEVLNIYPKLKGIQVLDDEGGYMFSEYRGKWIPDSPARRKAILDRFRNWQAFSNSSPSEGIIAAVRTFWTREHSISLYMIGDEFTGPSIQEVVDTIDRINRSGKSGERLVRIHALGFPIPGQYPQHTSMRYATLMRILCARNGGVFVGLPEGNAEALRGSKR